ncbi:mitochondrial genome maintenance MGM101-domain-containing protein [Flammula alnicola]|nr:mitochondrial genome maintenance MGM101-domain-containing protein [Flammula alnicola]
MSSQALQRLLFASTRTQPRVLARFSSSRASNIVGLSRQSSAAKYSTATPATTSTTPSNGVGTGNGNGGTGNGNGNGATGNGNGGSSPLPDAIGTDGSTDWSRSYSGLSTQPFPGEIIEVLLAPIDPMDVEMKPDGLLYLPEIKYRRILNKAFGPGGWGLAPRSETNVGPKIVSREYALVCLGRLVAVARGEQEYFDPSGIATATEGCKSNALMRCCKDLGVASELWDPRFIREFKAQHCVEVYVEHLPTKKKRKLWRRKDQGKFGYPYQE